MSLIRRMRKRNMKSVSHNEDRRFGKFYTHRTLAKASNIRNEIVQMYSKTSWGRDIRKIIISKNYKS